MFKRMSLVLVVLVGLAVISGCATSSRNYQGDIDSLNARVSSLQNEVSAKDQEISRIQGQLGEQQNALSQAETDKRLLSEKLDATNRQLEEQASKVVAPVAKAEESDLK